MDAIDEYRTRYRKMTEKYEVGCHKCFEMKEEAEEWMDKLEKVASERKYLQEYVSHPQIVSPDAERALENLEREAMDNLDNLFSKFYFHIREQERL